MTLNATPVTWPLPMTIPSISLSLMSVHSCLKSPCETKITPQKTSQFYTHNNHQSLLSSHESVRLGPLRVAIGSHGDLREKQCHKAPMTGNGFNMFQSHQFMVMTGWFVKFLYQHSLLWEVNGNQGATKRGIQRHTFLSPERLGMPPWCPHMCWFNLRMPT